jgi:hypothetical protein
MRHLAALAAALHLLLPPAHAIAAPVSAPIQLPQDLPTAVVPLAPKQYRLTMKVTMITTGDMTEGPGNTEDEIYFALAGFTKIKGVETVRIRRTVRPQISRDFWEMGNLSADDFRANIFEGGLGVKDTAVFGVLVGEQDNQALGAIAAAFTLAVTGLIERIAVDLAVGEETTQISMDGLSSEVTKLSNQMMSSGDELMGAVQVMVKEGKLRVRTPANTSSSLLSSTATSAAVQITGGGGKYRLDFTLEDRSNDRPTTQTFLSREQDQCDQPNLYVEKKGGGTVKVIKGDGGVPVRVKDDVFHWHCGSMSNDDETNAPDDTRYVEVTRAPSGGTIKWDCYHERVATPEYSW